MRQIKVRIISKGDKPEDYLYIVLYPLESGCIASTLTVYPNDIVNLWTGLKDKNGVEIYEGDILDLYGDSQYHCYVEYDEDLARFIIGGLSCSQRTLYTYGAKVVGNIYENSEILPEVI